MAKYIYISVWCCSLYRYMFFLHKQTTPPNGRAGHFSFDLSTPVQVKTRAPPHQPPNKDSKSARPPRCRTRLHWASPLLPPFPRRAHDSFTRKVSRVHRERAFTTPERESERERENSIFRGEEKGKKERLRAVNVSQYWQRLDRGGEKNRLWEKRGNLFVSRPHFLEVWVEKQPPPATE